MSFLRPFSKATIYISFWEDKNIRTATASTGIRECKQHDRYILYIDIFIFLSGQLSAQIHNPATSTKIIIIVTRFWSNMSFKKLNIKLIKYYLHHLPKWSNPDTDNDELSNCRI